ncbi:hypothetical protein ACUV84_016088 [Puccinellia chinampoensis]
MVRKKLPGSAAMVKMKDEVEGRGTSSVENGTRRTRTTRTSTTVQPSVRADEACRLSVVQRQLKEL